MAASIAIAGATGNLGERIAKALIGRGAEVIALTRRGTAKEKAASLESLGVKVATVDMSSVGDVAKALDSVACVVSAVQGLRDVIVDAQTLLVEAAVVAKIPRFIPSDFSTDFTRLPKGENRNFDLRREFHERLDVAPIASTAIFNGAFGEILENDVPLLDFKKKVVGYWDDPDWRIDFTTMDDTAAYAAAVALDSSTPRALHIASFGVSPRELAEFTDKVLHTPFELVRLGSRDELAAHNKRERAAHPEGEGELYSSWQQGQYMQSMFGAHHETLDNARYPDLTWTKLQDFIKTRS